MQGQQQCKANEQCVRLLSPGKFFAIAVSILGLVSCGGGGGSTKTTPPPITNPTYSVGGTVKGMAAGGSIVLQNKGGDNLTVSANGSFTFATVQENSSGYSTSILTLPVDQPCTLTNGASIVNGSNVTNIDVFCGPAFVGTFSGADTLLTPRINHSATLLPSGKVLVAGGLIDSPSPTPIVVLSSSELYDPQTNAWSTTGGLATARINRAATLLRNGKVLVAGGTDGTTAHLASAELYDPNTNTWSGAGNLATARNGHTSTLLPNGKVLVTGGSDGTNALASAELYDPATNTWSGAGNLATARNGHTATLLPNGKVLVAGGGTGNSALTSAELYDPATNTWSTTGALATTRAYHTATLLPNGKVLVSGGFFLAVTGGVTTYTFLASAELYDPATNTWSATGELATKRASHTSTLLPNGKVLVTGGFNEVSILASAELFDPANNTWTPASNLADAHYIHTATLLANGKLLVAGQGYAASVSSELYW